MKKLVLSDGSYIWVNPGHVLLIEEDFDGETVVTLCDGTQICVAEDIVDVAKTLSE